MSRRTFLAPAALILSVLFAVPAHADFTRIEEDHPSITYTGSWASYAGASLSGGSLRATGETGATASVSFNGTGITWVGYRGDPVREGADLYLDGKFLETVAPLEGTQADEYPKVTRFMIGGLAAGDHVLRIVVSDDWAAASHLAVDAFYIETGAVTQLRQESDPSLTYSGTWIEMDDPSVSGGSVLASREAGARATIRFTGTGIQWVGYRCACAQGTARITLDGSGPHTFFPVTSPVERDAQAIVYHREGLANTEHVLTIEVTGESAQPGQGPWVVIDAMRVTTGSTDGADTTPPEVALRLPAQNSTVFSPQVLLIADYFDNAGVTDVNYYADGVEFTPLTTLAPNSTIRYWWETAGYSYGPHTLTVGVVDAAGNETRSAPITVNLAEPTALSLTSPTHGAQLTGQVTLSASVTGPVTSGVSFYAQSSNGYVNFLGTDTTAPYAITRDTSGVPSSSTFSVWAETVDAAGFKASSNRATVTIQH